MMPRIKCYAINLESNAYRREFMNSQKEKSGLDINFFTAITPQTMVSIPHAYNPARAKYFTGRELYPTEIACALSHIELWRQLLKDEENDYYLIMEDDIHINMNIHDILSSINLSNIDLLKLSGQCKRPMKKIQDIQSGQVLYRFAFGPLDAACYVISKIGAEKLLPYCVQLFTPIDIMMDRSYDHGVIIYGVLPYPAETKFCFDVNNPLVSDIGLRNSDYKSERTILMIIVQRIYRVWGSVKRKWASIKLRLLDDQ